MCLLPLYNDITKFSVEFIKKTIIKLSSLKWTIALTGLFFILSINAHAQNSSQSRIGFSTATLGSVNKNDFLAAVKVWTQSLIKDRDVNINPEPKIYEDVPRIAQAIREKSIDGISLTATEYIQLEKHMNKEHIVFAISSQSVTEEYILLVHKDSGITKLEDLKNGSLLILQSTRMVLSSIWMDTLFAQKKLGKVHDFFSNIKLVNKLDKTILPVFFRQNNACIVTKNGYQTMVELNPQLGQQLKVLMVSPPLVPIVFCFRSDYHSPVRDIILEEISKCHQISPCRQILALFQVDGVTIQSVDHFNSTLELLDRHEYYFNKTPQTLAYKTHVGVIYN